MKRLLVLILMLAPGISFAGGWTSWATPTQIDIERGNGVMIYGAFGNASQCTLADRIYVASDHPEFEKIYSLALTAFTAGYQLRAYSHKCGAVTWYAAPTTEFNLITKDAAVNIRK